MRWIRSEVLNSRWKRQWLRDLIVHWKLEYRGILQLKKPQTRRRLARLKSYNNAHHQSIKMMPMQFFKTCAVQYKFRFTFWGLSMPTFFSERLHLNSVYLGIKRTWANNTFCLMRAPIANFCLSVCQESDLVPCCTFKPHCSLTEG